MNHIFQCYHSGAEAEITKCQLVNKEEPGKTDRLVLLISLNQLIPQAELKVNILWFFCGKQVSGEYGFSAM